MSNESSISIVSKVRVIPSTTTASSSSSSKSLLEEGCYHRLSHMSSVTKTKMIFGLFVPTNYTPSATTTTPALFWLSGLTCNDTNFPTKVGSTAFSAAEQQSIAIVLPDTSPRHDDSVPDVDSYDMGIGAGFYINATAEPYNQHYHMYDYITKELPAVLQTEFNIAGNNQKSISGHSMGGHGALTIALKEGPSVWKSVSAFSPICNPTNCPWGLKAFTAYLGSVQAGIKHDATCLLLANASNTTKFDTILIDQGTNDEFLTEQLKPEAFIKAAETSGQTIDFNMRQGFDHSYYFIGAFIASHINFHGKRLQ